MLGEPARCIVKLMRDPRFKGITHIASMINHLTHGQPAWLNGAY
ncbi:hypothetical protein EMIT0P171_350003 [Pseudomonas sp. IT-P171]